MALRHRLRGVRFFLRPEPGPYRQAPTRPARWRSSCSSPGSGSMTRRSMAERRRPYLFYDLTLSLCRTCCAASRPRSSSRGRLPPQTLSGPRREALVADDASITAAREAFVKPSETPALQHPERWGCPTDWPVPGPRTAHYLGIIRSTTATWCGLLRGQRPRAASTRWPRSRRCSTPWWPTRASRTSCRSPAANRRCIRSSSPSWTRRGGGRSDT